MKGTEINPSGRGVTSALEGPTNVQTPKTTILTLPQTVNTERVNQMETHQHQQCELPILAWLPCSHSCLYSS